MTRRLAPSGLVFLLAIAGGVRAQAPPPVATKAPTSNHAKDPAQVPSLPDAQVFLSKAMTHLRSNDLLRSQYT